MESEKLPENTDAAVSSATARQRKLDFDFHKRQSSVASQRKLAVLILALFAVIYLMIEAGKPERWYWLVPPESRPDSSETKALQIDAPEPDRDAKNETKHSEGAPATGRDESLNVEPADESSPAGSLSADDFEPLQHSSLPKLSPLDSSDYPESAYRFWAETMRRMSSEQRRDLFWLLKRARHRQPLKADKKEALDSLLSSIQGARAKFHQGLIDAVTYSKDGTDNRAQLANDLFEAESIWDRGEWPALASVLSGELATDDQRLALGRLQSVLDGLMLETVTDRTAQGWEGDSPAWGRMWERLMFEELPTSIPVTHLELSGQPKTYRNRPVQVRGWVRGAWKEALPIPELGIESLWVLVVRPEDSKATPYFLYARQLPEGFPRIGKEYMDLNQRIVAEGLFFKIRNYRDTQRKVQNSPMILLDTIETVVGNPDSRTFQASWLFQPVWLLGGALLFSTFAGAVAWLAYRSSQPQRFQPGPNRTREIHEKLAGLADLPHIKNDRERIQDLYE